MSSGNALSAAGFRTELETFSEEVDRISKSIGRTSLGQIVSGERPPEKLGPDLVKALVRYRALIQTGDELPATGAIWLQAARVGRQLSETYRRLAANKEDAGMRFYHLGISWLLGIDSADPYRSAFGAAVASRWEVRGDNIIGEDIRKIGLGAVKAIESLKRIK